MSKRTFTILASLMFISSAVAQNVYKWKDANGNVHYGDTPTERKVAVVDTRTPMKGAIPPTKAQKDRAEAYLSQSESGSGGMSDSPQARTGGGKCPRAK